jgi:hypothetical protein
MPDANCFLCGILSTFFEAFFCGLARGAWTNSFACGAGSQRIKDVGKDQHCGGDIYAYFKRSSWVKC